MSQDSLAHMDSWSGASVPELPGRGPEPHIRDTATGELAVAAAGHEATMYACGVTPYDATHIGHAATFTAWDLLVRAWRDAGHEVTYVQNVTDVDDPLLERAARDSESWRDLADREIARYRADMAVLRVLPPARLIGAVEALPVIERFAGRLADRGSLYELERDLYFARSADAAFGAVSRLGTRERSEEHTSELQSRSDLVCRLLLEKKKKIAIEYVITCQLFLRFSKKN